MTKSSEPVKRPAASSHRLFIILVFLLLAVMLAVALRVLNKSGHQGINSYEDCVAAGNPVMESYPPQCRAAGRTFTQSLPGSNNDTATPPAASREIHARTAPEGWTEYSNGELGLAYRYPSTWEQGPKPNIQPQEGYTTIVGVELAVAKYLPASRSWIYTEPPGQSGKPFEPAVLVKDNNKAVYYVRVADQGCSFGILHIAVRDKIAAIGTPVACDPAKQPETKYTYEQEKADLDKFIGSLNVE